MNINEQKVAEQLRNEYSPREVTDLDRLRKLDNKVKLPAIVFAYILGILGALVLGVGMCLAMRVIGDLMPLGIAIGIVGIALVSVNYPIYSAILRSRKQRYAAQIIALSNNILG